ncbi:putative colanic acid biosynthesis acetyltransferase [Roseibacillus persicicus]|uniref:putative colanic acid biosynthesis acetyltransferase n=1 Tax=Roseibacillus persicicus TaxID=454148 RepID=UPI00280D6041|nr:putative colanic acid biosynthesis acetyltransferase [Roseibacillus persicicus]MDQ8190604.1 putative colanic acid biosynthesis acetyltransferase [Roseibacillus persicicus]
MSRVNQDTHAGPSFSFANRLRRVCWNLTWSLLASWTPAPLHAWRAFLLRTFGAEVGKGVHVYPKVKVWAPWNLRLGDQVGVGNGAILYSQGMITIGKKVVVSQGAHLCAGTHDYEDPGFPLVTGDISVRARAWIAAESFVHPGITIGEGAVLGARSVAVKDLEAWGVYGGNPARFLKKRVMKESDQ